MLRRGHRFLLPALLGLAALQPPAGAAAPAPLQLDENDRLLVLAPHPDDECIATCGVIKHSNTHYELLRFAVSPLAQRRGVSRKLAEHAIAWARTQGASVLSLESAKSLAPALRLYRSLGFVEVPLPPEGSKYKRVDVKMELKLGKSGAKG